jgi:hypothetical protein
VVSKNQDKKWGEKETFEFIGRETVQKLRSVNIRRWNVWFHVQGFRSPWLNETYWILRTLHNNSQNSFLPAERGQGSLQPRKALAETRFTGPGEAAE